MSMDSENPVAAVVWPWRERVAPAGPAAAAPAAVAALRQAAVMGVVGAGLFLPSAFFALERFGRQLGKGVGVLLTWGLLVPFYYLCFGFLRLAQKIGGKDPLCRKFPSDEATYWTPRKPVRNVAQYRKQF